VSTESRSPEAGGGTASIVDSSAPQADSGGSEADGTKRASNVNVPSFLIPKIQQRCAKYRLFHDELIIQAISSTGERLADLITPPEEVGGGGFFDARPAARPIDTASGPVSSLQYRMTEKDFKDLDRLVERFKAGNRTRLIAVALTAYLGD
jgi:hypothetical protein